MTDYVVKPLDANSWDAFARLVERHDGVFGDYLRPKGKWNCVMRRVVP